MENQNYTITDDITKADVWISKPDPNSCVKEFIIPNKEYEIIKLKDSMDEEEEYFIRDEAGNLGVYYLCHKGDYVIKN